MLLNGAPNQYSTLVMVSTAAGQVLVSRFVSDRHNGDGAAAEHLIVAELPMNSEYGVRFTAVHHALSSGQPIGRARPVYRSDIGGCSTCSDTARSARAYGRHQQTRSLADHSSSERWQCRQPVCVGRQRAASAENRRRSRGAVDRRAKTVENQQYRLRLSQTLIPPSIKHSTVRNPESGSRNRRMTILQL
jgi:hypothetical protein